MGIGSKTIEIQLDLFTPGPLKGAPELKENTTGIINKKDDPALEPIGDFIFNFGMLV